MARQIKDETGNSYGRLVVKQVATRPWKGGSAEWICECSCGTTTIVLGNNLRSGNTQSCGCLKAEAREAQWEAVRQNGAPWKVTHGEYGCPTYQSWIAMKQRCTNSGAVNWHYYGGRGITYCKRWEKYANFAEDMGARPPGKSLDRIDPNGNYEPSNCRWATACEQARNRNPWGYHKGRV